MLCSNCGSPLDPTDQVCKTCGTPVNLTPTNMNEETNVAVEPVTNIEPTPEPAVVAEEPTAVETPTPVEAPVESVAPVVSEPALVESSQNVEPTVAEIPVENVTPVVEGPAPVETPMENQAPVVVPMEAPQTPEPIIGATPVDTASSPGENAVVQENKKGKTGIIIACAAVALIAIGLALYFVFIKDDDTENAKPNTDTQTKQTVTNSSSLFNGVYELNGVSVKLFAISDTEVNYHLESDSSTEEGKFEYSNGTITYDSFDTKIVAKIESGNLVVSESNESALVVGTYNKTSECTVDDYYASYYGKAEFFDNEYNGKYTNQDEEIYVYQKNESNLNFEAALKDNNIGTALQIGSDGVATGSIFDDNYELTFNGDEIHFVIKTNGEVSYDNTFKRESKLTKLDIINKFISSSVD